MGICCWTRAELGVEDVEFLWICILLSEVLGVLGSFLRSRIFSCIGFPLYYY